MGVGKDYANKGGKRKKPAPKQTQKRSANSRSKAASPAPKRPLKLMIAAAIMLVALGYLLNSLLDTQTPTSASNSPLAPPVSTPAKPPQTAPTPKPQPTVAKPAPKPTPQPSAPAEPRFEFYQMLPDSEVTTSDPTAYKSTPKDQAAEQQYLLQAGSFRSSADADQVRAQLLLLGLPNVHVSEVTNASGTTWYRVRTGPFLNRTTLKEGRNKLEAQGISPLAIKAN